MLLRRELLHRIVASWLLCFFCDFDADAAAGALNLVEFGGQKILLDLFITER